MMVSGEEEIGSSGPTLSQDASEKCPFMPLYQLGKCHRLKGGNLL